MHLRQSKAKLQYRYLNNTSHFV